MCSTRLSSCRPSSPAKNLRVMRRLGANSVRTLIDLLLARGFTDDTSLMEDDFFPYYLRKGDSWTKIDYTKSASDWMKPWKAGTEVNIVEFPISWHLDDAPPTMFVKKFPNSHGWVTGQDLGPDLARSFRLAVSPSRLCDLPDCYSS